MELEASWRIAGVVMEARELKSEKNKEWRGYLCKVATLGATFEVDLTHDLFKRIGSGVKAALRGHFEFGREGKIRLVCEGFEPITGKGGAA